MASYEALIFQQELFEDELRKICDKALDEAAELIMGSEWFANGSKHDSGSDGEWDKVIDLEFGDLRAWVAEYGAGTLAQTGRNPYWGEYLYSGLTSPMRQGGRVVKRGKGSHPSLDVESGEIVEHEGANSAGGYLPDSWQSKIAVPADPFLETLLSQAFRVFEMSVDRQMESLDMSRFIFKEEIQV